MQPLTFNAGQVLSANDLTQYADMTSAWAAYTPVWSADSGTTTVGNGSLTGASKVIGSTVLFYIRFEWGSTTTQSVAGSNWRFSIPETPDTTFGSTFWFVNVWLFDTSVSTRYVAHGYIDSARVNTIVNDAGAATIDNQTPFTFATGDRVNIFGIYQRA